MDEKAWVEGERKGMRIRVKSVKRKKEWMEKVEVEDEGDRERVELGQK